MTITISDRRDIDLKKIIDLYRANKSSSAYKPNGLGHPDYQNKGIGQMIVERMQEMSGQFHMQMLTANGKSN